MGRVVRTSKKYQVVIPREVREQVGLRPGQRVAVEADGDMFVLRPLPEDLIESLTGRYADGPSLLDDLMEEHRREVEDLDHLGP